jgi:hypothetical protein
MSDYVEKLSQDNLITLIDTIYHISTSKGQEINNALTAASMFWSIAEVVSK